MVASSFHGLRLAYSSLSSLALLVSSPFFSMRRRCLATLWYVTLLHFTRPDNGMYFVPGSVISRQNCYRDKWIHSVHAGDVLSARCRLYVSAPKLEFNFLDTYTDLADYYPVYFQACKGSSPVRSGINSFGLAYSIIPPSVIFGISVAKTGRYRPQLWLAWVLLIVGAGLLTTIHADTKLATAIGLQVIPGVALGVLLAGTFYPVLAPLPQALNASAIALYMFLRYFSQVCPTS